MCFLDRRTHITSGMCFPGRGTHITSGMCFRGGEHISLMMCFPGRGKHSDKCFRVGETHFTWGLCLGNTSL